MRRILFILFACLMLSAGIAAQEADEPAKVRIADIYLAKDDGSGKAGEAATGFAPTDIPIYCVVQLDSATPTTVKMNLVAVNVPGVKPETHVVSTSYTTKKNQSRVNFSGRPHGQWVAGKYRVDIFVGGAPAASRHFTVERPRTSPKPASEGLAAPKPKGNQPTKKS